MMTILMATHFKSGIFSIYLHYGSKQQTGQLVTDLEGPRDRQEERVPVFGSHSLQNDASGQLYCQKQKEHTLWDRVCTAKCP